MSKYSIGDKVLVEFKVNKICEEEDPFDYHLINGDMGISVVIVEDYIFGLAPLKEPTKYGTVVVVAGAPYTLTEEGWVYPFMGATPWEELITHGTPKVVWEPEE